ncbi:hypothetical protein FOZ62_000374, partial [Perkinsus olseni]
KRIEATLSGRATTSEVIPAPGMSMPPSVDYSLDESDVSRGEHSEGSQTEVCKSRLEELSPATKEFPEFLAGIPDVFHWGELSAWSNGTARKRDAQHSTES